MANNCLVTKLKSSVENSNLNVLGLLKIKFPKTTNPITIGNLSYSSDHCVVKTYDGSNKLKSVQRGYPTWTNEVNSGVAGGFGDLTIDTTEGEVTILVGPSKYGIISISYNSGNYYFSLGDIKYNNMRALIVGNGVTGSLKDLVNSTNLMDFDIRFNSAITGDLSDLSLNKVSTFMLNDNITGNVSLLGNSTHLSRINPSLKMTGTWESLFEALYNNQTSPKRSGTIQVDTFKNITFNGGVVSQITYARFSDDGIVFGRTNGGSELGTYNGSTWTYA